MDDFQVHEKIALTGGSSFLGSLVLKRLINLSSVKEIHIFDIKPPEITSSKFIFHRIDLTRDRADAEMAKILLDHGVTTFVHGALFSGPTRQSALHREVESIGTYQVLNAVAEAKVKKLVVHSSTFVYGAHSQNPNFLTETMSLRPAQGPLFVRTRVDVERQLAEFTKDNPETAVTVLRFAPVLGPNSFNLHARYFLFGLIPKVLGYDPLLQFIHEDDAIRAALLALSSSAKGVFNIVGKGVLPLTTSVHISGRLPLPIPSSICRQAFKLGYLLRLWDLPGEMVPFYQYL